jgi:gliding motility-associated lipoprotein GldH
MRIVGVLIVLGVMAAACDDTRVYEKYVDFDQRYWVVNEKPEFEFQIADTSRKYTIYSNVRNSVSYPWSRLFVTYYLQDSTGRDIRKDLINEYLFDVRSGKPFGESGLGDIYDHQFLLLKDYRFSQPGKYKVKFEQFMRTDTLQGILAVGLRVEQSSGQQ